MMIEAVAAVLGLTSTGHQAVGDGIVVTIVKGRDDPEECLELEISHPWRHKPKLLYFPITGIQELKRAMYVTTGSVCPSSGREPV